MLNKLKKKKKKRQQSRGVVAFPCIHLYSLWYTPSRPIASRAQLAIMMFLLIFIVSNEMRKINTGLYNIVMRT